MKNSTTTYCTILIVMLFMLFTNTVNAQDSKIKKVLTDIIAGKNTDAKKLLDVLDSDSRYQSDLYFWYARTLCYKNIALASENNSKDLEEARKSFNKLVEIDKLSEPSPNVKIISELRKDLYEGKNALKDAGNSTPAKVTEVTNQTDASEADKTVSLVVTGQGKTLDEAKQSALRLAIEQAFGAFISSKTEILNDQVIADQIASVSNGNIQSFSILNESQLPDGRWGVTLKALVSVSKLTSFVESKGIAIEIKGGLFALNIKQQLLNEQGEIKAVADMVGLLHEAMQTSFDYVIKSSDPKSLDAESKNWEIPIVVTATCNKNIDFCANYFKKTIAALSLAPNEVETYKTLSKQVYPVTVTYQNQSVTYYLRKQCSLDAIYTLTSNWEFYKRLFDVKYGLNESYGVVDGGLFQLKESFTLRKGGREDFGGGQYGQWLYISKIGLIFPTSGDIMGTYSCNDKRTLSQIEQMSGYNVKPRGVVSNYKNGGFVVEEIDGHGFVMSVYDIGQYNWDDAKTVCDELVLGGYNDWRVPSEKGWKKIYDALYSKGIGGLKVNDGFYWSNAYNEYATVFSFFYKQFDYMDPRHGGYVRAIRDF